jgi:molecular chaperone DnaK (HSP70)
MTQQTSIQSQSDSLIDILTAQCADLEKLLLLAKAETAAIEQLNFEDLLRVVSERATVGERLETYHRQIADIRMRLGESVEPILQSKVAKLTTELVTGIQAQDARTLPLLMAARDEMSNQYQRLNQSGQCLTAYMQGNRTIPIACDMEG